MAMTPEAPTPGSWLKKPEESDYAEIFMEHLFISDLQQHCAFVRDHKVEVLRAEVDNSGYDLVLEHKGIIRHVQLKSRHRKGKKRFQDLNRALEDHQGGCVVWMFWEPDDSGKAVLTYRWWGGLPRQKKTESFGTKPGRKSSQQRLGWGDFKPYDEKPGSENFCGIDEIAKKLFGPV